MYIKYNLSVADYVVIGISLLIAVAIGIWFRFSGNRQSTTQEYLMAGKDMYKLPVILSTSVTLLSPATMLGAPSEIMRFGITVLVLFCFLMIGTLIASVVFIPVYFQCGTSTSYEFLEMRYGRKLRFTVSSIFVIQMLFFMALSLYGPVLALGAVTNLSLEASIMIIGLICTFYCMMGGLKAVMWTDVFQAILMFTFVIILYTQGITEAGGIKEIFKKSAEGKRLYFWNFSLDMTLRYTFWNTALRGVVGGMAYFGTSQVEIQRMLSLKNTKKAQSSLVYSAVTSVVLNSMCCLSGLIMYAIFSSCDPVKDNAHTGLRKYDQIIPYYIVTRFSAYPGLTGLCVSGIFSGALSTLSSALNSISTVTVIDFIKPLMSERVTEKRMVLLAKILSVLYGLICIGLTFGISRTDSLLATVNVLMGSLEGPMVAIFLIGVLTRKGTENCALAGLIIGVALMGWIGYGNLFSGYVHPTLPLSTNGCPSELLRNGTSMCSNNATCLVSLASTVSPPQDPFILYKISFVWLSSLGFFVSVIVISIGIFVTGCKNTIPADSKCLSPVTRLWFKQDPKELNKNVQNICMQDTF